MTPLPPELEALIPEPVAHIHSDGDFCWDRKPTVAWWPESLFTADQVRQAMLDATERAAKVNGAVVSAYSLPGLDGSKIDEIRIERARQMDGGALWAVRYRGDVLNKQGEWEWEPMPSGRDEAFLSRARFDSAEEAIAAAIRGGGQG